MSRWLGFGFRVEQDSVEHVGNPDMPVMMRHSHMAHCGTPAEEAEHASRSSSWQSKNDLSEVGDARDPARATGVGIAQSVSRTLSPVMHTSPRAMSGRSSTEELSDWEFVGEDGERQASATRECSLSPPAEPSRACRFGNGMDGAQEKDNEGAQRKWLDAGIGHNFIVRGPTYLMVRWKSNRSSPCSHMCT